jgi:hypothetical protein
VFSYLARDGAAGAALGVMAVSWAALGVVHVVSVPGSRSGAIGLMLLAAGGVLALSAVAVSLAKPLPALVFMIGAARFALAGIYELSGTRFWVDIAGIAGLVVIGLAAYCVLAFELEGQRDEALLPTLRRGEPGAAFTHAVPAQLDGLPQEAGIRQTT